MRRLLPLLLLAACAAEPPAADDDASPRDVVTAPGPFSVGYARGEVTWRPPASDEDRTIPVEVWYPAPAGATGTAVTYQLAGLAPVVSEVALDGAPVADGPFPVAVYSHGSGGFGVVGYPYGEHLASHGWVVAAPDHVGNTTLDGLTGEEDPFVRILVDRPGDVRAILDAVEGASLAGLGPVGTTDDVLVFGHSFGGYTTLTAGGARFDAGVLDAACAGVEGDPDCALVAEADVRAALADPGDPRVDAIAPQAPAFVGALRDLDALPPTLLMSGARDRTTPDAEEAEPLWDALGGDDVWLHLPDGGHYTFIPTCEDLGAELVETFSPGALTDGCGPDFVPVRPAVSAMAAYLVAWGRWRVLGDEAFAAVFRGEPLHEGVDVVR